MTGCPKLILRYGAHAEKEYLQKLAGHFDAIHINANLLEISKAATTSLVATNRTKNPSLDFFLNPVTYLFGPYIQPGGGPQRCDLEWIKSYSKKAKAKVVKESYVSLAQELGPIFKIAAQNSKAIDFLSLGDDERDEMCRGVVQYQAERLPTIIDSDDMQEFKDLVPPDAVAASAFFAPYFYIADEWRTDGIAINNDLAARTVRQNPDKTIHQLVLMSPNTLQDLEALRLLVDGTKSAGVAGVWIWASKFNELNQPSKSLQRMRALVSELAKHTHVVMYAGGLWSMLLGHDGLHAVAHGVGYGEGRDVVSPVGAAAPTVRYYLPSIAKRVSVASIERCFSALGITDATSFHEQVCDCSICKGVLRDELSGFSSFGEMHRGASSSRASQTPTAAKLCRFHFLLCRLKYDRSFVMATSASKRVSDLASRAAEWPLQPTIRSEAGHVGEWLASFNRDTLLLSDVFDNA